MYVTVFQSDLDRHSLVYYLAIIAFSECMVAVSGLFSFDEVGDMSVVVGASDVEAGAHALAAQSRDQTGLGSDSAHVDRLHVHAAAHATQQPALRVHAVPL